MIVNIVKPRERISCAELRFERQRGKTTRRDSRGSGDLETAVKNGKLD